MYHQPVLLTEVIDGLAIRPEGIYADATLGGGGHARAILEKLGPRGRLVGFDQDEDAWEQQPGDKRFTLVPENFRHLERFLKLHSALPLDGLLADLGVSSHQFDTAQRGFSTRYDAPLDMRMDRRSEFTAANLLRTWSEPELLQLFEQYGEVSNARTLARLLVQARRTHELDTIGALKAVLKPVIRGNPQRYLAQVFQALRIGVNDELEALRQLLVQAAKVIRPGGRLAVITFHSLEDRLVKQFIKTGSFGSSATADDRPVEKPFRPVTKKPVTAGPAELKTNNRARSAKLRIAERTGTQDSK
ncbi:16S rRNA (cytosine(1402)-N(4))-methyltransferase RsmH [Compostibacter hankyongensis]|uniref:Ribosomal RNA small subunit methyltransferase H n=1 Tax=Compostibacter hankyongensis TaxID=1007089 RepID=A0ABP8FGU0_9BACT